MRSALSAFTVTVLAAALVLVPAGNASAAPAVSAAKPAAAPAALPKSPVKVDHADDAALDRLLNAPPAPVAAAAPAPAVVVRAMDEGGSCSTSGTTRTCTFSATGATQSFVVPIGVTSITADLYGAQGAVGPHSGGGTGGRLQATAGVSPGEILDIAVGKVGSGSSGGFPDGGAGGTDGSSNSGSNGCGGGGGTQISEENVAYWGEAGGGGGCGGDGYNDNHNGGGGGSANNNGGDAGSDGCGVNSRNPGKGGGAGNNGGGGGGSGGTCNLVGSNASGGGNGSTRLGGSGGHGSNAEVDGGGSGGGGGGGWFGGGGGGGGGQYGAGGGGGGGGSTFYDTSKLFGLNTTGSRTGDGTASISYTLQTTTTTLTVTPSSPSTIGGPVTLSAHVTFGGNQPVQAGSVTFSGAASVCGPVPVNTTTGVASCTFNSTAVANNTITATYGQTGAYGQSSAAQPLNIAADVTTTTIAAYNPAGTDAAVTAGVAVASPQSWGSQYLGGTITVVSGTATCSFTVSTATPQNTCTLHNLTPGATSTVKADYSGNQNSAPSSDSKSETQPRLTTTATLTAADGGAQGDPIGLTGITVTTAATSLPTAVQLYDSPSSTNPTAAGSSRLCQVTLTANGSGAFVAGNSALAQCDVAPTIVGTSFLFVVYPGDTQTLPDNSDPHEYKTSAANTQTVVSATAGGAPVGSTLASNTPVTLSAAVTYTSAGRSGQTVDGGSVSFYDSDSDTDPGTAIACTSSTARTCTFSPRVKDGAHRVFTAKFAGVANLANGSTSANSVTVDLQAPVTTLKFGDVPATAAAGDPITLTVTMESADPDAGSGKVDFYDASNKTTPICAGVALTTTAPLTASCVAHPAPGTTVGYFAKYTGDPDVPGEVDTQTSPTVKVAPASTTLAMAAVGASTFGDSVPLTATVTSQVTDPRAQPVGTVTFTRGATVLCSATTAAGSGGVATATCSTTALIGGANAITATFTPATGGATTGSAGSGSAQVGAKSTAFSGQSAAPDSDTTATVSFTVASGLSTPATGTVTVKRGGVTACPAVTLSAGSGSCSVALPTAAGTYPYTLAYTPDSANFAPSTGTVDLVVGNSNLTCTGGTLALYTAMKNAGGSFTFTKDPLVVLTGTATVPTKCTQASVISFTASATLFSTVTGAVNGTLTQAGGLCITGANLAGKSWLPSGFAGQVCFTLADSGAPSGVSSGSLTAGGQTVPLLNISDLGKVDITLLFSHTAGGADVLTLSTALVSTTGPGASLTGTIGTDGAAALTVKTSGLTLFGSSLDLVGTLTRSAAGKVGYSVSATLPGPLSPPGARGLVFTDVTATLSDDGLDLSGTGALGIAGRSLTVNLDASVTTVKKWTLTLSTSGDAWTPISGLTVANALSGTIGYDAAAAKPYTYDFVGGDGTNPFVTWATQGGATVTVDKIEFGSTTACTLSKAGDPAVTTPDGDPVLALNGSVTAGGTSSFTVQGSGCVDLTTTQFHLAGTADSLPIASGLTISQVAIDLTGSNQAASLTGKATAAVSSGGTTLTVAMQIAAGTGTGKSLVIGGAADLSTIGLPVVGFVAYASAPVAAYDTQLTAAQLPGGTQISLAKGLNARGVITLDAGTAGDLAAVGITNGATLIFSAALSGASAADFELALNIPTLKLYSLTVTDLDAEASYTREDGKNTFHVAVTATVPSESGDAKLALALGYDAAHTLTGTGSLTNLSVFGKSLSLTGSFTHTAGKLTGSLTLAPISITIPLPAGASVSVTNFTATLGTSGVSMSGTVAVPGAPSGLTLAGTFSNLRNYSVSVSGTLSGWTPTPGVTIAQNAVLSGTLKSASTAAAAGKPSVTTTTIDLSATGNLLTLAPVSAVSVAVTAVELSNAAPVGCSVTKTGDLWFGITGSVSLTLGSTATVTSTGCFDITSGALSLSASLPTAYTAPGGQVSIHNAALTFAKTGATVSVAARATLTINFDQPFDVSASLQFVNGAFVIGAGIDLGKYLGAGAVASAYVFFASAAVTGVSTTGVGDFGKQDFAQGVTVLGQVGVPAALANFLKSKGVNVPGGSSLVAKGVLDLANRAITLSIAVDLGAKGQQLFSANGSSVALNAGALQLSITPTLVSFGVQVSATLTVAPPTSDACNTTDNTVGLSGLLSLTGQTVTASFTVSHWQNALGICGLTVGEFTVQLGIDAEGVPNLGFVVQISSLPTKLAQAIGYQPNTNLKLAVNISVDNLLVDIEIGTKGSGQAALKPLTIVNQPDLLVVNYAQLYISPNGAKVGSTVYPAGYALIFNATVKGVELNFDLEVNPAKLSLYFDASVGRITVGGLTFGPTEIKLQAQATPFVFDFEFKGEIHLGPGTVDVGPLLRFSGYLDAAVDISVGTSGFSASLTADASVQGSNYLPQSTCWYAGFLPYPCDYHWVDDAPLTIPRFTIGIDVNSNGIDLQVPGISSKIHLPFSSNSVTGAAFVTGTASVGSGVFSPNRSGATGGTGSAGDQPVVLDGDDHVVTPGATGVRVEAASLRIRLGQYAAETGHAAAVDLGSWQPTGAMATARAFGISVVLPRGQVLVAGGTNGTDALASAEFYNPDSGSFSATNPMHQARVGAAAVSLTDGRVLVVGGASSSGIHASAEIYTPATGQWATVGAMSVGRELPVAVRLPDGRVLVAGGRGDGDVPLASAEIFDPATGRFTATAPLATGREIANGVLLPTGKVLVTAGLGTTGPLRSSELYDPATGTFAATGPLTNARFAAAATLLADGTVLESGDSATAELYDAAKGTWTRSGVEHSPRTFAATIALSDGSVVTAGGFVGTVGATGGVPASSADVEQFSPTTHLWTVLAALPVPTAGASGAQLSSGRVFLTGGLDNGRAVAGSYVYVPPAGSGGVPNGGSGEGHGGGLADTGVPAGTAWMVFWAVLALLLGVGGLFWGRRRESGRD